MWVEGDKTLTNKSSRKDWKKVVVLRPMGGQEVKFVIGFITVSGKTEISSATRKVKNGPFAMWIGPQDCGFFIASNKGKVWLNIVECIDINDESGAKLTLY